MTVVEMVVVVALNTASTESPQTQNWLGPLLGIGSMLLGGGGLAALAKVRHDKRMGVSQQEVASDDALSNRWQQIIETQTQALLEPMQKRLADVESEVRRVKHELEESRRKYWSAVSHIRLLYTWISRHLPADVEQTQIPEPPSSLAEDI